MDRGQAYTLEGTFAALVIVMSVLIGLQAVDTGPWSSNDRRESESLETRGEDFLQVAASDGTLSETVRCYGPSKPVFHGGDLSGDPARFERMLNHSFDSQATNYRIYVSYWGGSGSREEVLVSAESGDVSSIGGADVGVATHRLALYDHQSVRFNGARDCSDTGPPISELNDFYIPDVNGDSALYNVVEVRLVLW